MVQATLGEVVAFLIYRDTEARMLKQRYMHAVLTSTWREMWPSMWPEHTEGLKGASVPNRVGGGVVSLQLQWSALHKLVGRRPGSRFLG